MNSLPLQHSFWPLKQLIESIFDHLAFLFLPLCRLPFGAHVNCLKPEIWVGPDLEDLEDQETQDSVFALDVQDTDQGACHEDLQGAFQDGVPEVAHHVVDGLQGGPEVLDGLEGQNGEADLGVLDGPANFF